MQPNNSHPAGLFEILVASLAYLIGHELAQLIAPTLIAMCGWGFGVTGAILVRRVEYRPWPFIAFTFGVTLACTVPLAVWLAPKVGEAATALIAPVSIVIPLMGDKLLGILSTVTDSIRQRFGAREGPQ